MVRAGGHACPWALAGFWRGAVGIIRCRARCEDPRGLCPGCAGPVTDLAVPIGAGLVVPIAAVWTLVTLALGAAELVEQQQLVAGLVLIGAAAPACGARARADLVAARPGAGRLV